MFTPSRGPCYKVALSILFITAMLIVFLKSFPAEARVSDPIQISDTTACQVYNGGVEERNMIVDFFLNQKGRELIDFRKNHEGYDIYFESKIPIPGKDKVLHVEHKFKGSMFCWKILALLAPEENI